MFGPFSERTGSETEERVENDMQDRMGLDPGPASGTTACIPREHRLRMFLCKLFHI